MVKQQMYLPLHGGPPVPVRGTPPRKAKKTPPRPRTASLVVLPQPSPGATMTRRSTIATTGRPLVAPLQMPNGPVRRKTIATTSTRRTTTTTTMTATSAPTAMKPRASTTPTTAAAAPTSAAAPPAEIPIAAPPAPTPAPAPAPVELQPLAPPPVAPPSPPTAAPITTVQDPPSAAAANSPAAPINKRGTQRKPRISLPPLHMEPYDGLNSAALRQECKRRGISIWTKENSELRHKNGYIKLLQEDDQRRAAQDASAAIHKQDLAQLQLGSFAATSSSDAANASPSTLTPTTGYSFLSPSALMPTPASAAAATAAVLYPPAALLNVVPTQSLVAPPAFSSISKPAVASKPAVVSKPAVAAKAKSKTKTPSVVAPPMRSIRPRRGCYFRLINVLLTPEFNSRWREMNDKIADSDTTADVNQFWLDVHVAYMSVNQLFDGLHFHDALFKNVDPSVILAHEASRLRQMWLEVVAKYKKAVADSKKPPPTLQADGNGESGNNSDETQSFFDSCGKRLDLLYLHMGLLLEPELSEFVLNMAAPTGSTGSQRSPSAKLVTKTQVTTTVGIQKSAVATGKKRASVSPSSTIKKSMKPRASMTPPRARTTSLTMSSPPPQPTVPFSPAVFDVATREPEEEDAGQSYALVVSGELRDSAFETFAPHSFGDDGSGSSDYDSELPTRAMAPRKRRRRSNEVSTDIVELHSSALRGNELVPHQGSNNSRMHSTALTTQVGSGSDRLLPPDEWVILENRLRKVSESLDRCHRALSGSEGQVSESHRMSLESDLRFYSAIKQRLQEQLLMVMQGF